MKTVKLILGVTLGLIITSCNFNNLSEQPSVNLPTKLSSCLITTNMLSDGWDWEYSGVTSKEYEPNKSNSHLSSSITSTIVGLSYDAKTYFDVSTTLKFYNEPLTTAPDINKVAKSHENIEFHLELPQTNGETNYLCTALFDGNSYSSFGCQIQTTYEQHILVIFLGGNSYGGEKSVENFINPFLEKMDHCIIHLEQQ